MKKKSFLPVSLIAFVFILSLSPAGGEACDNTCDEKGTFRLDFVNIGTEQGIYGEVAHQAAGWGPIEPYTHGESWGGIGNELSGADCDLPTGESCDAKIRVTWAGDCFYLDEDRKPVYLGCLEPAGTGSPHSYDPPSFSEPDSFAIYGRAARVVLDPNALGKKNPKSRQLKMRVLDSRAHDAFEVFVRNIKKVNEEGIIPAKKKGDTTVLVYRFDPYAPENLKTKTSPEQWRVHTIDLQAYKEQLNLHSEPNALEVIIQSTTAPWRLFDPYGQLAVDWIELIGSAKKSCDP